MFLKPKKTTFNEPAAVYRRVTRVQSSLNDLIVYKAQGTYYQLWHWYTFDKDKQEFTLVADVTYNGPAQSTIVVSEGDVFMSGNYYFYWDKNGNNGRGAWVKTETLPNTYTTLKSAGFNNIAKYQTNQYIYVGSIDYVIKGEVAGTKTQPIKGAIMHLTSMNIQYYSDDIIIDEEDLVVVGGHLFMAESPDYTIKHMPRPYRINYVTLNSIL